MKKITFLHLDHCPYCKQARKAMAALVEENKAYETLVIEEIEESREPEKAKAFAGQYYYVPTMFVDGQKLYEAKPGESYDECYAQVKKVFDTALA